MPGTRCTVATCNNSLVKTGKNVTYHSFPKNKKLRDVWVQRCKRGGKWNPNSCHVCSVHFLDEDFERDLKGELLGSPLKRKLKKTAVPSINLTVAESTTLGNPQMQERRERHNRRRSKQLVTELMGNESTSQLNNSPDEPLLSKENVDFLATAGIPYCHHSHNFEHEKLNLIKRIEFLEKENAEIKRKFEEANVSKNELKKKIKMLESNLEKSNISENSELTITKILKIMSPIFTRTQIEKIVLNKDKIKWRNEDICRAFTLRYLGKRPYLYLRNELKVPLPAISTLQRWASNLEVRKGLLKQILDIMKVAAAKMDEREKYVVLLFDEVKIKSVYEYDKKADQVLGKFNQMQVCMVRSLFAKLKQPIYFEFDQKMTKDILLNIIRELHNASYTVIACVSDCGGGNMGLWKMLDITVDSTHFAHPVTGENIYMFADVPHLLKLIRNWLLDTGFVLKDGGIVNKSCLEALLKLDSCELKAVHNLTDLHINCEKFQRQNVRLAAQLLSHKTANALKYYTPGSDTKLAELTGNFIELVNQWFHLLNSYTIGKFSQPWQSAYGVKIEEQNKILDTMNDTFKNMRCCNKNSMQIFQKGVIITNTSLRNLLQDVRLRTTDNDCYILTHKLNQDALENLFSQLRTRGGLNDHPTPLDALNRLRMIILGKSPTLTQKNLNTEDKSDEDFIVAKVLRETEVVDTQQNVNCIEEEDMDSDTATSSTTSSRGVKKTFLDVTEGCEEDGLRYLAGFIAKKFITKYPNLGTFMPPQSTTFSQAKAPSWLQQISYGSLVIPSEDFFKKILNFEKLFRKFHKNKINTKPNVTKILARKIHKKFTDVDIQIITAYVKQRTYIRFNYLNKINNKKSRIVKDKIKATGCSQIKKIRKVVT